MGSPLSDVMREEHMTRFFAGVLTVIAVGILLVAYGLLRPAAAYGPQVVYDEYGRPMMVSERPGLTPATPFYAPGVAPAAAAPMRTVTVAQVPRAEVPRVVARAPRRDWKKTALLIGGSTATGAGVGGIFGGKKGALIGAAIGGGASTIYEATK
jgi:hypothetical protein